MCVCVREKKIKNNRVSHLSRWRQLLCIAATVNSEDFEDSEDSEETFSIRKELRLIFGILLYL